MENTPRQSPRILGRRIPVTPSHTSLLDSLASNATGPSGGPGEPRREKIWVGVRVRPLLPDEAAEGVAWRAADATTLTHLDLAASATGGITGNNYYYDRVFGETTSSADVYDASSQRLVLSAMEGYNFTLFAYGQTGSGKTHTMRVIMRSAAADIFRAVRAAVGREFLLRMSAVEIYNEVVKDLLRDDSPALKVMEDPERGTAAEGLTEEGVRSEQHLEELLAAVEARRHVRDTRMNASSSRSHQIVRIYIESKPLARSSTGEALDETHSGILPAGCTAAASADSDAEGDTVTPRSNSGGSGGVGAAAGTAAARASSAGGPSNAIAAMEATTAATAVTLSVINFVDLAGSERLNQASHGEDNDKERLRAKEASNINRSLLTLGTVIRALGDATTRKHVPYRDSKLTRLLQPSLSGNSRMAIICNISPAAGSAENTRAALHFANAAKKVTMRPKVNELADDKATIRRMQAEIQTLREQLVGQGWHAENSQLKGALRQHQEKVRLMAEHKDKLEKTLNNMQQFILRGDPSASMAQAGSGAARRPSYDGSVPLAHEAGPRSVLPRASSVLRSSWNPGDVEDLAAPRKGAFAGMPPATSVAGGVAPAAAPPVHCEARHDTLLLDYFLPPAVRRACDRAAAVVVAPSAAPASAPSAASYPASTSGAGAPPSAHAGGPLPQQHAAAPSAAALRAAELQKLKAPTGQAAEAALAALQAEVRCILHTAQQPAVCAGSSTAPITAGTAPSTASPLDGDQANAANGTLAAGAADRSLGEAVEVCDDGTGEEETPIAHLTRELRRLELEGDWHATSAGGAPHSTPDATCGDKNDLLRAVRTELARLRQRRAVDDQANDALTSLTKKLHAPDELPGFSELGTSPLPGWLAEVLTQQRFAATPPQPHRYGDSNGGYDVAGGAASAATGSSFADQQKGAKAGRDAGGGSCSHRLGGVPSAMRDSDACPLFGSPSASIDCDERSAPWAAPTQHVAPGTASAALPADASQWDSSKVKHALHAQKESVTAWYRSELNKVHAAFRASAERDVLALREAVAQYVEQLERVSMQKQLLLNQVLKLELAVEEHQQETERHGDLITQLTAERDQARFACTQARASARAAIATANASAAMAARTRRGDDSDEGDGERSGRLPRSDGLQALGQRDPDALSMFDPDDTWADAASAETLLPKIIELWEMLRVPLVYRSRFVRAFKGKEVFYYEMEFRRLEWKRSQAMAPEGGFSGRSRDLERATRALEWERKSLAANLKWNFTDEEREQLYQEWGINPGGKERKMSLVNLLWLPSTLAQPCGLERCVDLVAQLSGKDAAEQFLELVFSGGEGRQSALGVVMKSIVGSVTSGTAPKWRPPSGATTPRRTSNSSQSVGGRILSFISLRRNSEALLPTDRSILSGLNTSTAGRRSDPI